MVWTINELIAETGSDLSPKILQTLRNFDKKYHDAKTALTPDEIKDIQDLLVDSIGNVEFNKKLSILAPYSGRDTGLSIAAMLLKDFTYRTRNWDKISSDIDNIYTNFQDVAFEGNYLNERNKISLKKYGILYDLGNLNATMEKLNNMDLIRENKTLETLSEHAAHAAEICSHLDQTFNAKFKLPTGSVVFDDTYKKSEIYGKSMNSFENIIAMAITKYGHASKGISTVKNKISHINPTYLEENFSLRNYLYSDIYQIKLDKLIEKENQELLRQELGEQWLIQLELMYSNIERDIHDGAELLHGDIAAEGGKVRFAMIGTSYLHGGHQNKFITHHTNAAIRDQIYGKGKWAEVEKKAPRKLVCSEFVGMTVIAAIEELNTVVKQQLQEKGVENIPDTIIISPISEYEKLYLLTPQRLFAAMDERDALEKVETPREISKLVTKKPEQVLVESSMGIFKESKVSTQKSTSRTPSTTKPN